MHRLSPLVLLLAAAPAAAQTGAPGPDPPTIRSIRGEVWIHRGAAKEHARTVGALRAGDRVAAEPRARALVALEPAQSLHLDGKADFLILRLEPDRRELRLAGGGFTCHAGDGAGELRIALPSVSVRLFQAGIYRVSINKAGDSEVLALEGEAEVLAPSGSQPVPAGRRLIARGPASDPEFRIVNGLSVWQRLAAVLRENAGGGGSVSSDDASPWPTATADEPRREEPPKAAAPIPRDTDAISRPTSGGGSRR